MKINFNQKIKLLDGEVMKDKAGKEFDLRLACTNALTSTYDDEAKLTGGEKFKRYQLAVKINIKGVVELFVEDIALIKKVVGKGYGPLVVGRVYELLENQKKVRKENKK